MITSRRKRPLNRAVGHLRDTRLIIIATEGRTTEKLYFSMFHSTRVQLKVLPTGEDNRSDPVAVMERLRYYQNEFQLADDDELWLVIDVDRWGDKKLKQVCKEAVTAGIGLAVSNPCFETWLLLHYQAQLNSDWQRCSEVEAQLCGHLGKQYQKNCLPLDDLRNRLKVAMSNATAVDPGAKSRWPKSAGTHVYRIFGQFPDDFY